MVAKGEFEPGLSRLRVWHSTAELLRYLSGMYNISDDLPMVKVTPATRARSRMTANTDASTMVNWSCVRSTGTYMGQCIGQSSGLARDVFVTTTVQVLCCYNHISNSEGRRKLFKLHDWIVHLNDSNAIFVRSFIYFISLPRVSPNS